MKSKKQYNKSLIMKRAWSTFKSGVHGTLSEALKASWNIAKNGMDITIEAVYNKYYKQVLSLVKHISNGGISTYDAEEITQDVFIQVNKHLATYDVAKSKISTWIFGITKNKVVDYYRANKNSGNITHIENHVDNEGNEYFQIENTHYNEYDVENIETNNAIADALSSLNEKEKSIAVMYFIDQKQYNEISESLNIPMGSVKGMLSRIRVKLQDKLANVYAQY